MLNCKKCDGELKAKINEFQDVDDDFVEVFFNCGKDSEHSFFTRIYQDDLIED